MFLEIDAIEILRSLKKFWKLIFTCGLLGTLTGGLAITLLPSYWTATVTFTLVDEAESAKLKSTEIRQMGTWYEDITPILLYPEALRHRFSTELKNRKNQNVFATDFLKNSGIQNKNLSEQSSELSELIAQSLVLKREDEGFYSVRLTVDDPRLAETLLKQYMKFVTDASIASLSREIRTFLEQISKQLELQSDEETIRYLSLIDQIVLIQKSIDWLNNACGEKDGIDCAERFKTQERIAETEQLLSNHQAKFSNEIAESGLIPSIREVSFKAQHVRQIMESIKYDEMKLVTVVSDDGIAQKSKPIDLILIITTFLGLVIGFLASGILAFKVASDSSA